MNHNRLGGGPANEANNWGTAAEEVPQRRLRFSDIPSFNAEANAQLMESRNYANENNQRGMQEDYYSNRGYDRYDRERQVQQAYDQVVEAYRTESRQEGYSNDVDSRASNPTPQRRRPQGEVGYRQSDPYANGRSEQYVNQQPMSYPNGYSGNRPGNPTPLRRRNPDGTPRGGYDRSQDEMDRRLIDYENMSREEFLRMHEEAIRRAHQPEQSSYSGNRPSNPTPTRKRETSGGASVAGGGYSGNRPSNPTPTRKRG